MAKKTKRRKTRARRPKISFGATIPENNNNSSYISGMTKEQIEKLSKRNAQKIINGTDNLKSRGHTGSIVLPRLRKRLNYRSGLERRSYLALDAIPEVVNIETEPFMIEYDYHGYRLNYVPDIIIKMHNGNIWLFEVKPQSQVNEPKNQAKFAAANIFCEKRNMQFGLITNPAHVKRMISE